VPRPCRSSWCLVLALGLASFLVDLDVPSHQGEPARTSGIATHCRVTPIPPFKADYLLSLTARLNIVYRLYEVCQVLWDRARSPVSVHWRLSSWLILGVLVVRYRELRYYGYLRVRRGVFVGAAETICPGWSGSSPLLPVRQVNVVLTRITSSLLLVMPRLKNWPKTARVYSLIS
jgi:hypothetical protein